MIKAKNTKLPTWINKVYYLINKEQILTKNLIRDYVYKFFFEEINPYLSNNENHILILFRVQYTNKDIATIGSLKKINTTNYTFCAANPHCFDTFGPKGGSDGPTLRSSTFPSEALTNSNSSSPPTATLPSDLKEASIRYNGDVNINTYIDYINNLITFKDDHYKNEVIKAIIFSFGIREGKISSNLDKEINFSKSNISSPSPQPTSASPMGLRVAKGEVMKNKIQTYSKYKLPIAFEPSKYENVVKFSKSLYMVPLNGSYFIKIKYFNTNLTESKLYFKDQVVLEYKDRKIDENSFVRTIGKNKYTFILGKLELVESIKKTKFISPLKKSNKNNLNFLTLDIETYLDKNNYQIPYCICIYDGNNIYKFYLDEFTSSEDMLITAIKTICNWRYSNFNVYAHNFSSFDGIFLLKVLNKIGNIHPTIKDGKLISINFFYGTATGPEDKNNNYTINFYDSILLLQDSLRKLGKSFNVSTQKGNFDPTIVNESNYKLSEMKREVIKYCIDDCISLHQILIKFNELIFKNFNINIKRYPTLPSLSFSNFRYNYLEQNQIAQISGKIENDIKNSYTGGSTDMFIPFNEEDEILYVYDVNSLYPFVMKEFEYPIGSPTYFEGNIRNINKDSFGIFYCEIESPKYLEHPIIQSHIKTKNGIRTISPLGNWFDWICSTEMDNAIKFGYKFKIIKGYTFNKGRPFNKFIEDLYKLRLNFPKSDPMNYIAKLFMNSLYGRFSMNDNFNEIRIVNENSLNKLINNDNISIQDIFNLDNDFIVQIKKNEYQELISLIDNLNENHNINIAIASFVTAYARIHMSKFKNNKDIKLYYTDTDSIVVNKPLPDFMVDSTVLGKLKLEHIAKKGIFLAPKLYCLNTDNEIITKTRGLSHNIQLDIDDFEKLLFKDSEIIKKQNKWFKSIYLGSIKIEELPYSIKYTENKRELIFKKGKLVNTKPFTINSNKEII